jgi:PAS domain S-box-containing protein
VGKTSDEPFRLSLDPAWTYLFDEAADGMALVDAETGVILACNRALSTLTGSDRASIIGQNESWLRASVLPPIDGEPQPDLSGGVEWRLQEARLLTAAGTTVPVEIGVRTIDGDRRRVVHWIVRNICERWRAREALRLSEEKFAKAFHASPDAVNLNRMSDGRYVDVNPGFTRLTGYTREEVVGRTSAEIDIWADPADREKLVEGLARAGHVDNLEAPFRLKGGTIRTGLMSACVLSLGGEPHILSITRDIHDRKLAERALQESHEQLSQAQKMEAVGRLAGGVAHDFNNLLTVILGHAGLLADAVDPGSALLKDVSAIQEAADRAAALTRQLLAFSRKSIVLPRVMRLGDVVRGMEGMLRRLLGEDIDLRIADSATASVAVDSSQFESVVMNLAVNARDAMPDGGRLSVATSDAVVGEGSGAEWSALPAGHYVALAVTDTGCGMDAETRRRLFEPFFTTKPTGKGTGLGLSTVHGIVSQSHGAIAVASQPGEGSRFTILLPAVLAESAAAAEEVPPERSSGGPETILLAEDDPGVRRFAASVLRQRGYAVLETADGHEALARLESAGTRVDLLVADVVMPQLGGMALAERVAALRPGTRVLLISGHTGDSAERATAASGARPFLAKPFTASTLADKVRQILDEPGR